MIALHKKLELENLLKKEGHLLDLGCGNGKFSEPFLQSGYEVTIVDKDPEVLKEAERRLKAIRNVGIIAINLPIQEFKFDDKYDGIILSNVLPFQPNFENIKSIVSSAFESLNPNGFIFFTLFGEKDQWNIERSGNMTFCKKEDALSIINEEPYYMSEDYGHGTTMKGGLKIWHVFSLLYLKK